jgi:outer membrane immunogenic protein
MAIAPTWLVYGTGGFAFGTVKTDTTFNGVIANTIAGTAVCVGASASQSVGGWTLGAGIEGRITGNLTAKAEYLYIDLGSVTGTTSLAPSVPIAATWSSRVTDNIFRVGLNYQFGASPVVARY